MFNCENLLLSVPIIYQHFQPLKDGFSNFFYHFQTNEKKCSAPLRGGRVHHEEGLSMYKRESEKK